MSDIEQTIEMLRKQVCELQARNTDLNNSLDLRDKQVQDLMRDRQKCWDHIRNIGFSVGVNQGGALDEYVTQIRTAIEAKGSVATTATSREQHLIRLLDELGMLIIMRTGYNYDCLPETLRVRLSELNNALHVATARVQDFTRENKGLKEDLEASRKEREKLDWELKDYHKNYKELYECMENACHRAGIAVPTNVLKQECIIAAFNRISEDCVRATADVRLNDLMVVCHSAESRAGITCHVRSPWKRAEMVLDQMSCELARLQTKMGDPPKMPEEVVKKLWSVLQNLDPTGASMAGEGGEWSDETGKALALIERIARKAYEGQNVKAACLRLKDLL